jgi:two-component system chemotaxis response regulator CheY
MLDADPGGAAVMVVMVVEDSSTMRQLICHALRQIEGIVLVEAADGQDALTRLGEIRPDLILTDLNMPVMDGFRLIQEVRAREDLARLPILVLTTAGALRDQERARELSVDGYVVKPIKIDAVVGAVRSALGMSA